MKAAVFLGTGKMALETRALPVPAAGELRVRVAACGICGTDQHIYHGKPGSAVVTPPVVLGHELSGVVDAVGDGVQGWRAGDRITIDPNIYCGNCRSCRRGEKHLCANLRAVGVTQDGGMAEYCLVPTENAYHLPDELSFEEGALVEPLGCCLHGLSRIHIGPGDRTLVIGAGYIGLMMLQLLRRLGASPIVVHEPDPAKRSVALSLGADVACAPDDPGSPVYEWGGADVVVECVGRRESMQAAVQSAGRGGRIVLFGVADPDAAIELKPFDVFSREWVIAGSFINPDTHLEALSLIERGHVQVKPLVSHRFTLAELPEAMAEYPTYGVTKGIVMLASDEV